LRKKKVLKQQKKLHVRISNDDLLDTILPFLTRRQLFHLQFVNRRLKRLIDSGMEKNQLRQKLCLTRLKFSVYSLITVWFLYANYFIYLCLFRIERSSILLSASSNRVWNWRLFCHHFAFIYTYFVVEIQI
jgi:hypothetical protein